MNLEDLVSDTPKWREAALCAQVGGDLWYPDKGGDAGPAKRVCMACPVRAECLAHALTHDETHGVWGGQSAPERRALTKRRGAAA